MNETRRLAGVDVLLTGHAPIVRDLSNTVFGLCRPSSGGDVVTVESFAADARTLPDLVPQWVLAATDGPEALSGVIGGPRGRMAAFVPTETGCCLAWLDDERRVVRFVVARTRQRAVRSAGGSGSTTPSPGEGREACAYLPVLARVFRDVLLDRQRVLLHSGCVARPDGVGWLFIADGGGGKTTTVLSLLRLGCRLLGDDLNAVRADEGVVEAFGWPEPLNVTERTASFFPELERAVTGQADWRARPKVPVSPHAVYGQDCIADRCRLAAAHVVKIAPDGPALRRMAPAEALDHLFAAHRFAGRRGIGRTAFAHLAALVSRVPTFELRTGPSAADFGRWFLERAAAGAIA